MRQAQPFPFDAVLAGAHRRQQQVGDAVVQHVEFVDIENAAVGFGQQPRLEHRRPRVQGGGHVHRAYQPVFGDAQGHLD